MGLLRRVGLAPFGFAFGKTTSPAKRGQKDGVRISTDGTWTSARLSLTGLMTSPDDAPDGAG